MEGPKLSGNAVQRTPDSQIVTYLSRLMERKKSTEDVTQTAPQE